MDMDAKHMEDEISNAKYISIKYISVYKYIFNRSLKAKDYDVCLDLLDDLRKKSAQQYLLLSNMTKNNKSINLHDLTFHVLDTGEVIDKTIPIIIGLRSKAVRKGSYGILRYRNDVKKLNTAYKLFEDSGNKIQTNNGGP
jgi:hypothetical protein